MSVSSVSQRPAPQPQPQAVQQQRAREAVKSDDKQMQTDKLAKQMQTERFAEKQKASKSYADETYARAKENTTQNAAPKGRSIDVKA
ncbi:hypothetical protein [Limnohabitans sp. Rim8]|jgi:hypothetical protein|uniref:hypothetical protein n=1 Tax=Limnohabitans sp. Rim8 TaxID=1100718 RepID=UPI0026326E30|nr:hypothetical protein [Limnohabitans sp. Rim8]